MEKPVVRQQADMDLELLIACCEIYMRQVEAGTAEDSDAPHYIFEEAMMAVYGDNVFEYINAKCK